MTSRRMTSTRCPHGRRTRRAAVLSPREDRFRLAATTAPHALALIGTQGVDEGKLLFVNASLCSLFGFTEDELLGAHGPDAGGDRRGRAGALVAAGHRPDP